MSRQGIIERTIKTINELPDNKAEEIADFADFVMKRYEEHQLITGLQNMTAASPAFNFLNNEEDLYAITDLKEVYNGQR